MRYEITHLDDHVETVQAANVNYLGDSIRFFDDNQPVPRLILAVNINAIKFVRRTDDPRLADIS